MNTLEKKIEEYLLEFKKDKTYFQETKEKFMDLFTSQKNQALLEQKQQLREKVEMLPQYDLPEYNSGKTLLPKDDVLKLLED